MKISNDELLILRACLATQDQFESSFRSWESTANLDLTNYGAVRLLPTISHRLEEQGIESPLAPKLRGIRRFFWAKQQVQKRAIKSSAADVFEGDEVFALKGLALAERAYAFEELRPFDDIDLLVRRDTYLNAPLALEKRGWLYSSATVERSTLYLHHAKQYKLRGVELDLHWTAIPFSTDPEFDDRLMASANRTVSWAPNIKIPSATYCLIHSIVHGNQPNDVSPVRWVLDAYHLTQSGDVEWDVFEREVCNLGLKSKINQSSALLNKAIGHQVIPEIRGPKRGSPSFVGAISQKSYFSRGLWLGRILRILGSHIPIVNSALHKENNVSGPRVIFVWLRENVAEAAFVFKRYGLASALSGTWSLRKVQTRGLDN